MLVGGTLAQLIVEVRTVWPWIWRWSLRLVWSEKSQRSRRMSPASSSFRTRASEFRSRSKAPTNKALSAELEPGMRVTTSGTGGVFPSGVIVGTIKQFTVKELEGVAIVQPAMDLSKVQDVFVISGIK